MTLLFIILVIVGISIVINNNNNKKIARLKHHYNTSLKGSDKRAALDAGRAYYSALRKGKMLTIYDEQAITNDLSTMKSA